MNTDDHGHGSVIFCDRLLMIIDVIFAVDILKKFKTSPVRCETFVCGYETFVFRCETFACGSETFVCRSETFACRCETFVCRCETFACGCETFACIKVIDCFIDIRNKAIRILYFLNVVGKYLEHDFDYLIFAWDFFFINPIELFPTNDCIGKWRYIIFSDLV